VKRRLLTLAAVVSLLLCVATVWLWVRSYFVGDIVHLDRIDGTGRILSIGRGVVQFAMVPASPAGTKSFVWLTGPDPVAPRLPRSAPLAVAGFGYARIGATPSVTILHLHFWPLAVASALLPLLVVMRSVQSNVRRHIGRCPACGYDLRATPARCPECGAVPAATPAR
jgi:hypothetical protein